MTAPTLTRAETNAVVTRLVLAHAVLVAVPVVVLGLLFRLWLLGPVVAVLVAAAVTAWRLRDVDRGIGRRLGARPVSASDEPRLSNLAESVAMAVGVNAPQLHVIETDSHNAVLWGSGRAPCSFAVTRGLLDSTDRLGLEAVLGHHLSIARDGRVEIPTLAAHLFGPLAVGPIRSVVQSLVLGSLDDRRVVLADIEGARATRYPPGAAAVLDGLVDRDSTVPTPSWFAPLFFVAPVGGADPFNIHPPVADRADLLREL